MNLTWVCCHANWGWVVLVDTEEEDGKGTGVVQYTHAANHLAADWGTQSSARNGATRFMFSHLIWAQNNELVSLAMCSQLISHERREKPSNCAEHLPRRSKDCRIAKVVQCSVHNESIVKCLQAMRTLPGIKLRLRTWSKVYWSQWLFFQGLEQEPSLWPHCRKVGRSGKCTIPSRACHLQENEAITDSQIITHVFEKLESMSRPCLLWFSGADCIEV